MDDKFVSDIVASLIIFVMILMVGAWLGKPSSIAKNIPAPVRPIMLVVLCAMLWYFNPWAVRDRGIHEIEPEFNAIFDTRIGDVNNLIPVEYVEASRFSFRFDTGQPVVIRHPEQFSVIKDGSPHWTIYISPEDSKWVSKCSFYQGKPMRSHKGEHQWLIHGPKEDNLDTERIWIFSNNENSKYFVWGTFNCPEGPTSASH